MSSELIAAVISTSGALVAVVAGYVLTKRAEREVEWRRQKLEHYKEFVASLSGAVAGETTAGAQRRLAKACNDLLLFAPQGVLSTLARFREEISVSNPAKSQERHDALLSELLLEIRADLRIQSPRDPKVFAGRLWASGVKADSDSN